MQGTALSLLPTWENFYVIIGTAAASLTGLMFVVVTLSAGVRNRVMSDGIGAFSTPTVFHFGAALLVAAMLSAPWSILWNMELLLGLCGLGGVTYNMIVFRRVLRVLRQSTYNAVLEDWLWYIAFPLVSYIALIVAALLLPANAALALFVIAAAAVLLVFFFFNDTATTEIYTAFELFQPDKTE